MAAYIDLNAIRACRVKDPKDYRYCGYAERSQGRTFCMVRRGFFNSYSIQETTDLRSVGSC